MAAMAVIDDDYDDMSHALGRPANSLSATYRNHYCTPAGGDIARRFEELGWWDFVRTINDGSDAIYSVNGAGRQALAEWMETIKLRELAGSPTDG